MARRYQTLLSVCLGVICAAAGEASLKEAEPTSDCQTGDAARILGVGLDLTTSYAVAAIRNPDGSIDNLMKVCEVQNSKNQQILEVGLTSDLLFPR